MLEFIRRTSARIDWKLPWILPLMLAALPPVPVHADPGKPIEGLAFGVANAPGQVEDRLPDIWMEWGKKGRIAGFAETPAAQDRLRFWSRPELELDLAKETGFTIFRLGADWGRIMPAPHVFDQNALRGYREIFRKIHDDPINTLFGSSFASSRLRVRPFAPFMPHKPALSPMRPIEER